MLAYIVPAVLIAAALFGAQMAFGKLWLSILVGAAVAVVLPYGDLHGKPLVLRLLEIPKERRRRKRSGYRRHRYYSP